MHCIFDILFPLIEIILQLITAIGSSDENIESDVTEPRRCKKVAKKY